MDEHFIERFGTLEANDANIFHQLNELKAEMRDIRRLTSAVERIAMQTENITNKVEVIDQRLDSVERAPADDFKYYRRLVIGCVLTAIIGMIIGALM